MKSCRRWNSSILVASFALSAIGLVSIPASAAAPFDDALAVWHMADASDSTGAASAATPGGNIKLGVALEGEAREASLRRGGDGRVAECQGGWLNAGQGANNELNPRGMALSMAIRLRDPSGRWDTSLFSKHGGHDKLVYNLFTVNLGSGMDLGFELGIEGRPGVIQVKVPIAEIGPSDWHDVVVRYSGAKLELFVDGVKRSEVAAAGALRQGNPEPCLVGAESAAGTPARGFVGQIDHAALWARALSDEEVAALSGGAEEVARRNAEFQRKREAEVKAKMERIANDPHRPRYHFLPPCNWMNDPNGLIQWKGQYHLFYQHNPNNAFWGDMHWGHAVSTDLMHWKHLPMALAPTPGGPDEDGVFSGSAIVVDGAPVLMFTGVAPEVQCIAYGSDDMLTWKKFEGNPVIAGPPDGLKVTGFRDPCPWKEDDGYHVVIGSGIEGQGGAALLYRSPDMKQWEYLHPLCVGDKDKTGTMWECPCFFPLGEKHALLVSVQATTLYFTGTYADHTFTPALQGNTDFGGHFYAAQSFEDERGRRILFGWVWEGRSDKAQRESGWAGVQSLPRVLSLRPDGMIGFAPVEEVEALRGPVHTVAPIALSSGTFQPIEGVQGDALELHVVLDRGDTLYTGLAIRCSPDGEEQTRIVYDKALGELRVDRTRSSLDPETTRDVRGGALALAPDEPLDLRVFIDRSVIEVFANGRMCLTSRVYPTRKDSLGVALFAEGGTAQLTAMDAWPMKE